MLQEGHRLKKQGVDVVVGVVETHGRAETAAHDRRPGAGAAAEGRVPRRGAGGDGPRRRAGGRPTVALVDELAHTNAPGSRHAKRYQDVEELLRAGINVITTMNIQHLESLYDIGRAVHRGEGQGAGAGLRPGRRPTRS